MIAFSLKGVITAAAFLVALSPIVLIHEFGHFIVCRLVGIRVLEFSFGFGKVLWSTKKGHTQYSIRAIPFGGFVNPAGEMFVDNKDGKNTPKDYEFASKSWWKKLLMVISGALMNYVLAFIVFTSLVFVTGVPVTDSKATPAVLGEVVANYPAQKHGLEAQDKILKINETPVNNWQDVLNSVASLNTDLNLKYERNGEIRSLTIPFSDFNKDNPKLGIAVQTLYTSATPLQAFRSGLYQCWFWTKLSLTELYKAVSKTKKLEVAGPIGIFHRVHQATQNGWMDFVWLIGLLSLAVGMFNLFPIPVLDGGYAVVFIWEGITGKLPSVKVVNIALNVGLALLLMLVLYASVFDVKRIFIKQSSDSPAVVETVEPAENSK
ncbi:Putative membrane-associated zinc metalloprotease [Elusimicrobium minutum Pei191]|uniref:Putative membrane-associated zinc metalloprotease n=1 Tax=Elusimicrobium minutum (strain Pei191) TaxID=445932 RepID=B2KCJ8_ELUMP|nr:M50 family metallopeptidase [Elusimicrobium minutum]ACC98244.1 Putative membrane-associated zinc metalloprotease [Elusimicrobium minutum Pei191]